jgi:hypothetical protein
VVIGRLLWNGCVVRAAVCESSDQRVEPALHDGRDGVVGELRAIFELEPLLDSDQPEHDGGHGSARY